MGSSATAPPFPTFLRGSEAHHPHQPSKPSFRALLVSCRSRRPPAVPFVVSAAAERQREREGERERERERESAPSPSSAVTYSASISTDIPVYEPPGACFDDYLADRPRIFRAMFPDKQRSRKLNDEEWRIQMLPIQFMFVSANPVIDMRLSYISQGESYRGRIPLNVPRFLELQATRWELQGLDSTYKPPHFELDVHGVLYSHRRGGRSRLKGNLQMSISLVLPQVFALVPDVILRSAAESILKGLLEKMKKEVDGSLLADYRVYSREMQTKQKRESILPSCASYSNK